MRYSVLYSLSILLLLLFFDSLLFLSLSLPSVLYHLNSLNLRIHLALKNNMDITFIYHFPVNVKVLSDNTLLLFNSKQYMDNLRSRNIIRPRIIN